MKTIQTNYKGLDLKANVLYHNKWSYLIELVEPFEGWKGGCHIPTFARSESTERHYLGERGDWVMKETLCEIYEKANTFHSQKDRYQRIYKDYLEEINGIKELPIKVKVRIENKLKGWFMNEVFGEGKWNVDDEQSLFSYLEKAPLA